MTTNNHNKPNQTVFERRRDIKQKLNAEWNEDLNEEYLNIMNNYNWELEVFQEGNKYGLKMWDGTTLLPAEFDNFRTLTLDELNFGDKVVANINGKWGVVLIEKNSWKWLLQPEFDTISYPNDIVALKKEGKWGIYCFSQAEYLISMECETIPLSNGFLCVNGIGHYKKDGLWGIINDDGEFTEALFSEVEDDVEGPVKVKLGEQWGYVRKDGTISENQDDAHFWFTME